MLSVTSEAATNMSYQAASPKSAKPDPSQGNDSFQALVDSRAPADTGNDRANATAQQQSASQRRTEDASTAADTKPSRDPASAKQPASTNSDDRNAVAKQGADANTDAVQQSSTLKAGTATSTEKKSTEKSSSETTSAPDASTVAASAQRDAASVTTPNAVAVVIPVIIASTDIPTATPASGNATAQLAIAAAAIAANSPASAAPAPSSPQIKSNSDAAAAVAASAPTTVTASAADTITASAAVTAPAVTTATASDAAATAKVAVQAAASEAVAAPVKQQATPTVAIAATIATDVALTAAVAATAPVSPKTTLLKAPVAAPAKAAASSASDTTPGAPDPSAAATPADAAQNNAAQPPATAVRQEGVNSIVDAAKADPSASSSSTTPAAESAHEHSPVNATAHPPTDASDAGVQGTGTIEPQPTSAAATAAPAGPLTVTAATNAAVPLNGLAFEIAVSARSGKSRFEIRLDPADLGRIDVRIDVDRNGQVTSHLTVEKPETLSMLRQDAPQLQRALDDAGLRTGNGGLQFSLRDQSSSGQDNGNETGRNAQRLVISDEDTIPAAVAGRTYGRVLGSGSGVDIRV